MHLSLRTHHVTHHLPHIAPEVLWRWMFLALGLMVFGLLCYVMLLAAEGKGGTTLIACLSTVRHWAG